MIKQFIQVCLLLLAAIMVSCGGGANSNQAKENDKNTLSFAELRRLLAEGKKQVGKADSLHLTGASILAEQAAKEGYSTLYNLAEKAPDYRNAAVGLLGQAAFLSRNFPDAKVYLKEALELNNRDVQSLMWLGLSFLATSQPDSAQDYFAKSINYYDEAKHRARIVEEIFKVGQTSYEYGVSYEQDGYPQRGFDYKIYGTYVTSMAWELDKDDSKPEIKTQAMTYANALLPQARERDDERRIDFLQNVITQLNEQ